VKIWSWVLSFIVLASTAIFGVITVGARTERVRIENLGEEEKIRTLIQNYFDKRYQSRKINHAGDFSELTDESFQAYAFIKAETDKLEIEIYNAKLHHLGYTQYKYTLNFLDISIDKQNQRATVSLTEGHDVVFEISEMISRTEPVISSMRNLNHTLTLKKLHNEWKIVSDSYEDYLWRMIHTTRLSKEEILGSIDESQNPTPTTSMEVQATTFSCNLNSDTSAHSYNRNGVVAYAHQYATEPNPAYYYFPSPNGDCTNFISQAIHHGSNAEEVGSGTYGWYYNSSSDYSPAWTHVQSMFDFITQYLVWGEGPEGCNLGNEKYNAEKGDVVQFEWRNDATPEWDHGVIIVRKENYAGEPFFFVAGHTDDLDNYALDNFAYESRRFIHIERIDGYVKLFIPIVIKANMGGLLALPTNPYPGSMDIGGSTQLQAYPPYPAP